MVVWVVLKIGTACWKILGPVLDGPGLIPGWKWSLCALHACKLWFWEL